MKTIKFLSIFILASLLFVSCEDQENLMYDNVNGKVLTSFIGSSAGLPVREDAVSSTTISVEVSTVSTSDRTVQVSISDASTATPNQYSLSDFVIPAGSYNGSATLTGNYDALPDNGSVTVVLNLTGISGIDSAIGDATFTVRMERFCPIDIAAWEGTYDVSENFTAGVNAPNGLSDFFGESYQIELTVDSSDANGISLIVNNSQGFNTYIGNGTVLTFDTCNNDVTFDGAPAVPVALFRTFEYTESSYDETNYVIQCTGPLATFGDYQFTLTKQ